jgi:HAE1 family hydrophobic/amphiphilic exporter-1
MLDRFNHWFNRQAERYKHVIAWALDHRWSVVGLATFTFVFALAMRMIKIGDNALVGFGFFPEDDQAELNVSIEAPPGSNIDYTRLKAEEVARAIHTHPEVRYTYTTIGGGQAGAVDVAMIYVKLTPKHDRSISVEGLSTKLRDELKPVAGVKVAVFATDWGGGRKQVALQVRGDDAETLAAFAERALAEVEKVPGAVDVGLSTKGQKPELTVDLKRGVAGSIGVTVAQVAAAMRPAFAGVDAGDWQDPSGEMRKVRVRLDPESRTRASDLRQLPILVQTASGAPTQAPLGQVASVEQGLGPAVINHLNRDKVVSVEFNTSGRSMGEVTNDALARMEALDRPPGVRITKGAEAEQQGELFGQIFLALGVAVGLMYLILVMQFGSFLDPLAIMLSLPLSLIGVMLGMAISRNTINIMSLIGVILLMGIVAKNAILLIDFAKWAREKNGLPLREALIEAGAIRLRPILMTTVALIAGMLPVAMGSGEGAQFRSPLGIAVIGGVITSTVLTLVAIPTFYEILDEWRTAFSRRFGVAVAQQTAEHRVPLGALPESGD